MPANVGEMFYYGDVPWHGQGTRLDRPANFEEALRAGGLDWEVDMVPLCTKEDPPSPVRSRMAVVRKDRPAGDQKRVLGVVHPGFSTLQNREGIEIFDSIFGQGKRVYHTGGYLGAGEVVWVLAELPKNIKVTGGDRLKTYSLFTNSHNGSIAIDFRLTTVRVVCQNTLSLALTNKDRRTFFKKAHKGDYKSLRQDVELFFADTLKAVDDLEIQFKKMLDIKFGDELIRTYLGDLFPTPQKPVRADYDRRVYNRYMAALQKTREARSDINQLRSMGKGTNIPGVRQSLWGTFNAVLEYIDHYNKSSADKIASNLLGTGAAIKRKAYNLALKYLQE